MKKIPFILLAVGLPVGVATLANPGDVSIGDWSAMTILALGCFAMQWLAFVPARLLKTERFYDLTGSLTYIAVTVVAVVTAAAPAGAQWLIAAMILVWAGRLGSFLFRRIHAAGGDQRFDHIKVSSSRFFSCSRSFVRSVSIASLNRFLFQVWSRSSSASGAGRSV